MKDEALTAAYNEKKKRVFSSSAHEHSTTSTNSRLEEKLLLKSILSQSRKGRHAAKYSPEQSGCEADSNDSYNDLYLSRKTTTPATQAKQLANTAIPTATSCGPKRKQMPPMTVTYLPKRIELDEEELYYDVDAEFNATSRDKLGGATTTTTAAVPLKEYVKEVIINLISKCTGYYARIVNDIVS